MTSSFWNVYTNVSYLGLKIIPTVLYILADWSARRAGATTSSIEDMYESCEPTNSSSAMPKDAVNGSERLYRRRGLSSISPGFTNGRNQQDSILLSTYRPHSVFEVS